MGRARLCPLVAIALVALFLSGCSEKETNPFDPAQDTQPPVVTSFVYSGGNASWSTDEDALCVLEYGPVDGDYDNYVYESTKYHSTFHQVSIMGMEDGTEYKVRVRSRDRAGNEAWEAAAALPDTVTGASFRDDTMTLSMIDVGWGLSMLLTTPAENRIMIDAGSDDHLDSVLDFLRDRGIASLDAAVVTHYHWDHYANYIVDDGVFESFSIGQFIMPDHTNIYRPMTGLVDELTQFGIPWDYVTQGDTSDNTELLDWDPTPGFRVEVLAAGLGGLINIEDDSGTEGMNTNNDSAILRISFGDVSFVTTGDGEHFTEYNIIDAFGREGVKADLLQIAHHGSDDSSSELWLDNVSPRIAMISNAMIEAALEKEEVLQGIRAVDADYFVTDRIYPNTSREAAPDYGHIEATTDGHSIEIALFEHAW